MKRYSDGTDIPGTENDPDEDTSEVNPNSNTNVVEEVPAFVLEMSRANQATREANAETERLRAEIHALRNPAPKAPEIKLEEGDAFNNPNKLLDAFRSMLDSTVAPIKKDMAETQRARAYATMKDQIRAANPAFAKIEGIVDQIMVGQEITEGNITRAVEQAVGRLMLSNPSAFTKTSSEAPPNNEPVKTPPPHLSSKPRVPAPDKKADPKYDISNFNENEKRLMREKGLTPKQFVLLRDTDPNSMTPAAYKAIMEDKT